MAYSNYGAKVFRNGERMMNRENVGVYDEDEADFPSAVRIFANIIKNEEKGDTDKWWKHSHHAVLGDGEVRLCAYKDNPELWIWEEGKNEPERIELIDKQEQEKVWKNDYFGKDGEIEVSGKKWKWKFEIIESTMLNLRLTEPDGTTWTATAGYGYGAGFEK